MFFLLTFILVNIFGVLGDENVLCTATYCQDVSCSTEITNCDIQNATHRGVSFPSPDTCNCCQYCLSYLGENDVCGEGSPDGTTVTDVCGPGLTCNNNKCQQMDTDCFRDQKDYLQRVKDGTSGTMETRPECDGYGLYETYKCIPGQTCYCVHENGARIFGTTSFTDIPSYNLKCGCSRNYYDAIDLLGVTLRPGQHFRCASDGNFDALQCISGKTCICVDKFDGTPLSGSTPEHIENIEELSCYDSKIHPTGYYKPCEKQFLSIWAEIEELKNEGYSSIMAYDTPRCDLDGTYAPLQSNKTHKMCADQNGGVLIALEKSDPLATTMNCNCIRAKSLVTTTDIPDCLENGNYNPIQCRRGFCRCVDDNGNQVCKPDTCPDIPEEDKDTLVC